MLCASNCISEFSPTIYIASSSCYMWVRDIPNHDASWNTTLRADSCSLTCRTSFSYESSYGCWTQWLTLGPHAMQLWWSIVWRLWRNILKKTPEIMPHKPRLYQKGCCDEAFINKYLFRVLTSWCRAWQPNTWSHTPWPSRAALAMQYLICTCEHTTEGCVSTLLLFDFLATRCVVKQRGTMLHVPILCVCVSKNNRCYLAILEEPAQKRRWCVLLPQRGRPRHEHFIRCETNFEQCGTENGNNRVASDATWQRVRVVKEMDSKSIGLCPRGFESLRCRCRLSLCFDLLR